MAKVGISVTEIGRSHGATAMEVNLLLRDQGFLEGEPGAYFLTPKGKEFGFHEVHDNGYGGFAHRSYETTHFDPAISEVLQFSPEGLAKVREDIAARRLAQSAQLKADRAEADERFRQSREQQAAEDAGFEVDTRTVIAIIAGAAATLAAGIGIYKLVQWRKRIVAERARDHEQSAPGGS